MNLIRQFFFRLGATFQKRRLEDEMAEELRQHLELRTERNLAAGMSPEEARSLAQQTFGGVEQIKERAREQRPFVWLEHAAQDLRYAARQLRRNSGFTTVVVLSLALGIGVNSAVFSRINDRLLKMLPVKNPGELVLFQWLPGPHGGMPPGDGGDTGTDNLDRDTGQRTRRVFSFRIFERFRSENSALTDVFAVAPMWGLNVSVAGQAEMLQISQLVSANYYSALGAGVVHGRTFRPEDDQPGATPVAVISHRYWQTRFAGELTALGKTILINQTPVEVVGITPPDFRDTISDGRAVDITLPLALAPRIRSDGKNTTEPTYWWVRIMGRLKPGATIEQARVSLEGSFAAGAREGMRAKDKDDLPRLRAVSGGYGNTEADRSRESGPLKLELGITTLVLLAACANVANLLLARGAARRRELGVRLALGASRGRLVRQLLTESVLLALLGGALGTCLGWWGADWLSVLAPDENEPPFDWRVLGFSAVLALLTSIGFGLAPALRATRLNLSSEFQGGMRKLGGGRSRLSQVLLVVQVALSLMLLVGAGLFVRTVRNLRLVDVGFNRTHLLLFWLDASVAGYSGEQAAALNQRIADQISVLPGVRAATYSSWPMLVSASGPRIGGIAVPGYTSPPGDRNVVAVADVAVNFFETYQIPVLLGRGFESHDGAAFAPVAVVNQAFAKKYFAEANPIGHRIRLGGGDTEIVGVVRDIKQQDLRTPAPPTVYGPPSRNASVTYFTVRTTGEPTPMATAIRSAVHEVDRNLPLAGMRTEDEVVEGILLSTERLFAQMSVFVGFLALALACVGLYGLMSYSVVQRTGEIGLRMALGALPRRVLWMILRESFPIVLFGVIAGTAGAWAATRVVAKLLYGLSPTDPLTYCVVSLLLIVIASFACLLPARRAAKVDPMVALRRE